MKKPRIFSFVFAIFAFFSLFAMQSVAEAKDAWVYGVSGQYDVYVVTETFKPTGQANYTVSVKFVAADKKYDLHKYGFYRNDGRFNSSFTFSIDGVDYGNVYDDPIAVSIFRYCNEHGGA